MEAQQFAYWLQGFAELSGDAPPTPEQWKSICEHLAAVFHKVTPPVGVPKVPWPGHPFAPQWPKPMDDLKPIEVRCSVAGNDGFGTSTVC